MRLKLGLISGMFKCPGGKLRKIASKGVGFTKEEFAKLYEKYDRADIKKVYDYISSLADRTVRVFNGHYGRDDDDAMPKGNKGDIDI